MYRSGIIADRFQIDDVSRSNIMVSLYIIFVLKFKLFFVLSHDGALLILKALACVGASSKCI